MKRKSTLSLMELAVMILIFSLAAVLCLRAFVWADQASAQIEERDHAAFCAQTAAEVVKNFRGEPNAVCEELSGRLEGAGVGVYYDSTWNTVTEPDTYVLHICVEDSGIEHLGKAAVSVCRQDSGDLFRLTVCWQEVD